MVGWMSSGGYKSTDSHLQSHGPDERTGLLIGSGGQVEHEVKEAAPRFRYLIAAIIVVGYILHIYGNYILYVVVIRMVASDVLANGLTQIRTAHLSQDPLADAKLNAALPGTCPIEVKQNPAVWFAGVLANLTDLSISEQWAMVAESAELEIEVRSQLSQGRLVDWDASQRGLMFTAHTIGGLLAGIPLSRLGLAYGSKIVITICLVSTTLRALSFPLVAGHSPFWVTFLYEVLMGSLGLGITCVIYPLAATWLLPHEANACVVLFQLGSLTGASLANFISSQLVSYNFSWTQCYYLPVIPMALISIVWMVLGADRPEKSRFISDSELKLLQTSSLASTNKIEEEANWALLNIENRCCCTNQGNQLCPAKQLKRTPNWRTFFTCPTIWALVFATFAASWNIKVSTMWPTYFANIIHLSPSDIGTLSGVKGLLSIIFGLIFVWITRIVIKRHAFGLSLTTIRKINQLIATGIFALATLLVIFFNCNIVANITSVLMMPLVSSFNIISFIQMPLDMSPEDSGLIASFVRTFAIGDIVSLPSVAQILASGENPQVGSMQTWRIVWSIGLALKVIACGAFLILARAEPKSYAHLKPAGPCKSILVRPSVGATRTPQQA